MPRFTPEQVSAVEFAMVVDSLPELRLPYGRTASSVYRGRVLARSLPPAARAATLATMLTGNESWWRNPRLSYMQMTGLARTLGVSVDTLGRLYGAADWSTFESRAVPVIWASMRRANTARRIGPAARALSGLGAMLGDIVRAATTPAQAPRLTWAQAVNRADRAAQARRAQAAYGRLSGLGAVLAVM
jgi:hypothetical protein